MIADDQPIVRWGLRQLVSSRSAWRLCGEAGDGEMALDLALTERPHVAVMSFSLGSSNGLDVARRMRDRNLETRVLLYTDQPDLPAVTAGVRAGVRGHVLKSDSIDEVERAIEAIANGRRYFSSSVSSIMDSERVESGQRGPALTARELEVAQLIAEGLSNRQIASRLGRSIKTIESHRMAVMRKADVHSTAGLVRYVIKNRLSAP